MPEGDSLYLVALRCLRCDEPVEKCRLTDQACQALEEGRLGLAAADPPLAVDTPGRPPRPRLVAPRELPRRRAGTIEGRATLLHALAHIEFNAINLAWDAVYRFRGMPARFYADWAGVAREEALHFRLLCDCLGQLGYAYGDFDAHNGLWEMACRTAHDPLVRMALVPRVLEARGLDVTPGILARLRNSGDTCAVEALEVILHDEIGHVEIGSRWFRYICGQRGMEPEATFARLLNEYMRGQVKQPFHYEARLKAGFNEREMQVLERLASSRR
jgi:uncharacterized ferritin-like protein (DUF455 family)